MPFKLPAVPTALTATRVVIFSIIVIILGIMMITMTSMGIQCYNAKGNESFKKSKGSNFSFLVLTLVVGIFLVIGGIVIMVIRLIIKYYEVKAGAALLAVNAVAGVAGAQ